MNKILTISLVVSILGLGFVLHQNTEKQNLFEGKVLQKMQKADTYYTIKSDNLLSYIRNEASGYAQFEILEEQAFMIIDSTAQQVQNLDINDTYKPINYRQFWRNKDDFKEQQENGYYHNIDSISSVIKTSKLHNAILKNLLNRNKIRTLNYLFGMTGGVDCWGPFQYIMDLKSSTILAKGTTLKVQLTLSDSFGYLGRKRFFINGKLSHNYKITPTETGKHEYLVEVKDDNNKTVFEHTHHFFVENCKLLKQPINE